MISSHGKPLSNHLVKFTLCQIQDVREKTICQGFKSQCFTDCLLKKTSVYHLLMWRVWLSSAGNPAIVVSDCQPSCKLTLIHSLVPPEATCVSFITQSESSTIVDPCVSL